MNSSLAPRKEIYALGLVALSAVLYGFLGYLGTTLLNNNFSVPAMLFWRFLVATFWILSFQLFKDAAWRPQRENWKTMLRFFCLGAIFYSGGAALYFLASRHTGTGLAMVIFFSHPLFVALLVWLRQGQGINRYTLLSLALILIGLFLLKGQDTHTLSLLGIALAVIASIFYAFYVISSKKILAQLSADTCTVLVCLSCTLVFGTMAAINSTLFWPVSPTTWFYILALGIISTALPIQLLLKGMQVIGPIQASMISALEPIITLGLGVALLGEWISPLQGIGILVMLLGAFMAQLSPR